LLEFYFKYNEPFGVERKEERIRGTKIRLAIIFFKTLNTK
jgi:hypothetical protein